MKERSTPSVNPLKSLNNSTMNYANEVYQTFASALGLAVLFVAIGGWQTKHPVRTRKSKRGRS